MRSTVGLLVVLAFFGCGSPPEVVDGGPDAEEPCASDLACDDGTFCNGAELCAPGSPGAGADGCAPGLPIACTGDSVCDEAMDRCSCGSILDADGDGVRSPACGGTDCDDSDPFRFPGNVEICDPADRDEDCDPLTYGPRDADGDGHNDAACCNVDADGTPRCGGDCDDARRAVSPDSPELCNDADDDCDASVDEMVLVDLWPDLDGDMFGDASAAPVRACPGAALAPNDDDCDDASATRNPAVAEVCNGIDDDCDALLDGPGEDDDGDGHADDQCAGAGASDCDDGDATVHDGAAELCDGLDQDCSNPGHRRVPGSAPENASDPSEDRDGDGRASPFLDACTPSGTPDCDDGNPLRHGDGVEVCNGVDDDCDSIVDEAPRAGGPSACAFVDVAPTLSSTCAALGDGTVWCWGFGAGTFATQRTDLADVIDLGAGDAHTCAVTRAGQVWCWGTNAVGQLGDGTRIDRATAVRAVGVDDAVEVDAAWGTVFGGSSSAFTCARRSGGGVACWGAGDYGQLGNGTDTSSDVPVAVPGITDASELDVGQRIGCVRRATGRVVCWGQNVNGELGTGASSFRSPPAEVTTITDAIHLGVGQSHACVVRSGGSVWCWGENDEGQLGRGGAPGGVFVTPAIVAGITDAIEVAADQNLTCATSATGAATCWGDNVQGRVGDGTTTRRTAPAAVVGVADGSRIELGRGHGCALTRGGDLRCWGGNASGQLGDGTTAALLGSIAVHRHGPPVQVDTGGGHSCVRRQLGDVWCWGNNSAGAVGQGAIVAFQPAARVSGTGVVTRITAGMAHTCALRGDGTVMCWGDNSDGRIGDGTAITRRTSPTLVSGLTDAVDVSAGDETTCARRRGGAIVCWGAGVRAPAPLAGVTDAIALDVGARVSCAVTATGNALCWGEEFVGELGDGGSAMSTAASPVALAVVDDAIDVEHGLYSGCVRRSDASVWCWGSNAGGFGIPQFLVGDGSSTDRTAPVLTHAGPARDAGPGASAACLVSTAGALQCWGSNFQSSVGDGSSTPRPSPVPVGSSLVATEVDCEGNSSNPVCCALASGAPHCWGYGRQGELGGTTDASVPTRVPRF